MKNPKYIIPVDDKYWRVKIRIDREAKSKCFSYSKHGGKKNALNYATIWRDEVLEEHGMLDRLKYKKGPDYFHHENFNAVIGVRLTFNIQNGKPWFNWTVTWSIDGITHKRHFSVNAYGNIPAFKRACELRYLQCGKLRIINKNELPCKLPRRLLNG